MNKFDLENQDEIEERSVFLWTLVKYCIESYKEAVTSDKENWLEVNNDELNSLVKNVACEFMKRPENGSVVDCKSVFQPKRDERHHVRKYKAISLLACHFLQITTPVANIVTEIIIAVVANYKLLMLKQLHCLIKFLWSN